jgi:methanogenic corrinoid protein MtbC1
VTAGHDDEAHTRESRFVAEVQRVYADALLAGDPRGAEATIREAIDAGLAEAVIDDHVIGPALRLVGDLWESGDISIGQEHLATSISMRVLTLQREAFRMARQRSSQRVLLAGAQGEQHVVGLEMAASLILHAGYDVRMFGPDLPVREIAAAMDVHRPVVVGFTTAGAATAANLPAAFDVARSHSPAVGIMVGGLGVDEAWAATRDVVLCRHVAEAVDHVDAFVMRAAQN